MKRFFWANVCLMIVVVMGSRAVAQYPGATTPPDPLRVGYDSIHIDEAERVLTTLTSESFGGRGTGQPGFMKAAHYMAGKLAEYGFEPVGDGGTYFQAVPFVRVAPVAEESFITGPNELKITGPSELGFSNYSDLAATSSPVAFVKMAGANIVLPEGTNLEGKIVVLLSEMSGFRALLPLMRQRPACLVRVSPEVPASRDRVFAGGGRRGQRRTGGLVEAIISKDAAQRLVKALDGQMDWIEMPTEDGVEVHEVAGELTLQCRTRTEEIQVPNVIGWYPGSDPNLRHEYLTIGAHLDHLGTRPDGMYAGADDNGSGSTALLMVARAIHLNPVKPKRSVLIMWFTGEELGLVGSRYYCQHPVKPLKDMICMLNMDMVGRGVEPLDSLHLIGSKRQSMELHELMLKANEHVNFKFEYDQEGLFGRSDQASFSQNGIPVTFVFGEIIREFYHQKADTLNGIDFRLLTSAAKLNYLATMMAAEHGHFEPIKKQEAEEASAGEGQQ